MSNFLKTKKKKTHKAVFNSIPVYTDTLEMTENNVVPVRGLCVAPQLYSLNVEEEDEHLKCAVFKEADNNISTSN